MGRSNIEGANLRQNRILAQNKYESIVQTLAATFTMNDNMPHLLFLDPGGAGRTVLLPAETKGAWFALANTADADEDLTVKEDSNTTTIGIVSRGAVKLFFCDGTTWHSDLQSLGDILDANGNELLTFTQTASAVNEINIENAATGSGPVIEAEGGDTNIDLLLTAKGTGAHVLNNGTDPITVKVMGAAADYNNEIVDLNGNEILALQGVTSAVNEIGIKNAITGVSPTIEARGGDTNIGLRLAAKGTAYVHAEDAVLQKLPAFTSLTTAGAETYTAAMLLGGVIVRDCNGGARTDTLSTAALLVAAIPGAAVGDTLFCRVINGSNAAEAITIAAGTGGTIDAAQLSGSEIISQNTSKTICIRLTNVTGGAEAYAVCV